MFRNFFLLLVSLQLCLVCFAQSPYDNLKILGKAPTLTDEQGATLDLMAFNTKYKEKVVGLYFQQGSTQVRFYMNAPAWDKFKQDLLQARDNWAAIQPRQFEEAGAVKGYKVANRLATLRLALQGATDLSERRLMLNASGGAATPTRVSVAMKEQNLKDLVDKFYKIDDFLRQG